MRSCEIVQCISPPSAFLLFTSTIVTGVTLQLKRVLKAGDHTRQMTILLHMTQARWL